MVSQAPALVWAMAALAVTGIAIAEERYLIAGGFGLLQLGVFTLFLTGYLKLLSFLTPVIPSYTHPHKQEIRLRNSKY